MRRYRAANPLALGVAALALLGCGWEHLDAIAALPPAPSDAAVDGAPAPDAASPVCASSSTPFTEWTFDSNAQGWAISPDTGVEATVSWTGSTGNPAPGALQIDVTPAKGDAGTPTGAWVVYDMPPANLSGHTLSAWVWLNSSVSPAFKLFVQTGTQYAWADGGTLQLESYTWTCVSMDALAPAYQHPGYDPTSVISIGFELLGTSPFRVYVDTVRE